MAENVAATAKKGGYTGSGLGLLGHSILWSLLITITLFIGTPWVIASAIRYIFKNTTVDGKKLTFDGTGGQLIGKWLLWILLTICTIGIYSFWIPKKLIQWIAKHVYIEGSDVPGSWEGGAIMLFLHFLAAGLISGLTLGLLYPVGLKFVIDYIVEKMTLGGGNVTFAGDAMGFLGRWIIWALLSIITLGIYSFWAATHLIDWVAQNSHI